ncbi:high affinity nitrate transporter 2.6-like protein [Tanacetum coccineum]
MERGFLSQKGSEVGIGVKEKNGVVPSKKNGVPPSVTVQYLYKRGEGGSSYARALIKVQDVVELKANIVMAMPKLFGEGFYTCNLRVKYECKPPRCAYCKVFGHILDECPTNINSDVVKNMKKPSQTPRGVPVGPKVELKKAKQVFRQVSKKNNVNTSSNKKKDVEPTIDVSNSNSFDMLNSVENDVDLGTNATSNLANQKVNSSGSSFWNVESSSTCTTHIVEKIDRIERLIIDGKVTLVNDDSEDEVASVDNNMAIFWLQRRLAMVLIVCWNNGRILI